MTISLAVSESSSPPNTLPSSWGGYIEAVDRAKPLLGDTAEVKVAGAWHLLPAFIDALAQRVRQSLDRLPLADRSRVPVVLTAHSMPKRVVDREPGYVDQLKETAEAVVERVGLGEDRWQFAYQSAGHSPEEWLKPDIKELFPDLKDAGHARVVVVPIQFLADHLEVLYDIDVAAREEAERAGIQMVRTETFNDMPEFIAALADLVDRELAL